MKTSHRLFRFIVSTCLLAAPLTSLAESAIVTADESTRAGRALLSGGNASAPAAFSDSANHGTAHPLVPLLVDMTGAIDGADFVIKVPTDWNGTLLVWAHAYGGGTEAAPGDTMVERLLGEGYALAGSGFRNSGWQVEEGLVDTLRLPRLFKEKFGCPVRTILWGLSMGTAIVMKSAEIYPSDYDGFIAACSLGAGLSRTIDQMLAVGLAYDLAFGWDPSWGQLGNVRDDIDFDNDVVPIVASQIPDDSFAKWELIRLVNGFPFTGWWDGSVWSVMYFVTAGRADRAESGSRLPVVPWCYRLPQFTRH